MTFDTKHQRFRGYPGDWYMIYARYDGERLWMKFGPDAPGSRKCLIVDGDTGAVIKETWMEPLEDAVDGWYHRERRRTR